LSYGDAADSFSIVTRSGAKASTLEAGAVPQFVVAGFSRLKPATTN